MNALIKVKGEIQRSYDEQREKERLLSMLMDRKKEVPFKNRAKEETIDKIKYYIDENACDFTLSLGTVADYFGLNASYISRLFKQKTGSNFSQYVMRKRIGLAIEIMQHEGGKVHEVAEKVGFIDPHYFGICFKRVTGKSVSEFKSNS